MIDLERLCLDQQTTISKQQTIGELLEELLMFRALSDEENKILNEIEKEKNGG